ncbi:hypothetical protein N7522_012050 [Penicillium canescens]|uniref:Uncharacterized protein n=1 Tax=Penicillium canescens TaxID=5083 RepID=A0AAD6HZZ5_PENCN|nr:uncharacterized protein N7446_013899 [Penicillium canescens]KAJ5984854.1 hypothetical protein N7522_012050 [Penicillium canescens]KAJ6023534.1 hypothetical protein N7460_013929 [Penicillium canescens]KAJ6025190.1 hypothetical protein N7444_012869 [Penicillium canescens]KAJ6042833.1 hypothetical protein N7446_013899 [Penicillium canescens]KAJ6159256.1 hypothetical protein N7485_012082 [Penicillium canescens]
MSVQAGYISAENNESPVQQKNDTQPAPYKLSDVYVLQWQKLAAGSNKIKNLKYFIRKDVQNPDTLRIIDEATGNVAKEWPGTTFSMESDEGKALLRTPNGVGLAYMLIHKPELGVKVPTQVRVFKTTNKSGIVEKHLLFYIGDYKGA